MEVGVRMSLNSLSKDYKNKFLVLLYIGISLPIISFALYWWMGNNSSNNMAAPVVVNATAKHTATVIFLHGLGDTGHGWSPVFQALRSPNVKFVCPTANIIPVSLNGGFRMPSWFDIKGLEPGSDEDEAGIKEASNILQTLISDEEKKGIARNRIIVGGFSQGGAVALYSALASPKPPLAGILALSTWLPLHKSFPQALQGNQNTPILQCHGEADPLVALNFGKLTGTLLKAFNSNYEFKTYPGMGHSSCEEEIKDVKTFIEKQLPTV